MQEIREAAELALGGQASLTRALEGMLEVLPLGASKGSSVALVLEELGVAPEEVMALGDGENDVEMLRLAGVRSPALHRVQSIQMLGQLHENAAAQWT
jgi:HAD superfamily hydrolase (TIGR01484 family)